MRKYGIKDIKTVDEKGCRLKAYECWESMLNRCYNPKTQERQPRYKGCSVCEEWLIFSNFKAWYDANFYILESDERVEIDKDILVDGNKVYSPETCIFAPKEINNLFRDMDNFKKLDTSKDLPTGIYYFKDRKKYIARIRINGVHKYLGCYSTIEEAERAYLEAKSNYILQLAEEYKEQIPSKLYKRMVDIASFFMPKIN